MDQQCVNDGALPGVGIRGVSGKRPGVGVLTLIRVPSKSYTKGNPGQKGPGP